MAADDICYLATERAFEGSSLAVFISFWRSVVRVPRLLEPVADGLTPIFRDVEGIPLAPLCDI